MATRLKGLGRTGLLGLAYVATAALLLVVALFAYVVIGLLSLAGGAYLARKRPDLGGFRRHTKALWHGFNRHLRRMAGRARGRG
jgi:hypothetical protein